ncbi:hypothetical protein L1887_14302 [Cichorium endivia]|nr:hypothetical protein L1887_14302 [Cichorium endivia]
MKRNNLHKKRFLGIPSHRLTPSRTCEAISGGTSGDGGPSIKSSLTITVSSIVGCASTEHSPIHKSSLLQLYKGDVVVMKASIVDAESDFGTREGRLRLLMLSRILVLVKEGDDDGEWSLVPGGFAYKLFASAIHYGGYVVQATSDGSRQEV